MVSFLTTRVSVGHAADEVVEAVVEDEAEPVVLLLVAELVAEVVVLDVVGKILSGNPLKGGIADVSTQEMSPSTLAAEKALVSKRIETLDALDVVDAPGPVLLPSMNVILVPVVPMDHPTGLMWPSMKELI